MLVVQLSTLLRDEGLCPQGFFDCYLMVGKLHTCMWPRGWYRPFIEDKSVLEISFFCLFVLKI